MTHWGHIGHMDHQSCRLGMSTQADGSEVYKWLGDCTDCQ